MATITLTIPDEKLQRIIDATKFFNPIPLDENEEPEFTDNQWAKEILRREIIRKVQRHENYQAKKEVSIQADDNLVS